MDKLFNKIKRFIVRYVSYVAQYASYVLIVVDLFHSVAWMLKVSAAFASFLFIVVIISRRFKDATHVSENLCKEVDAKGFEPNVPNESPVAMPKFSKTSETKEDREMLDLTLFVFAVFSFVFWIGTIIVPGKEACPGKSKKETIDSYFEEIRDNEAALIAFFSQMPKGGDLHNHYSGAIYAESYLENASAQGLWIDSRSLSFTSDTAQKDSLHVNAKSLSANLRQKLMQDWSVKDYFDAYRPPDKHFFDAFGKFPKSGWPETGSGLLELKRRAKSENVQYLEVMFGSPPYKIDTGFCNPYNNQLISAGGTGNWQNIFDVLYNKMKDTALMPVQSFVRNLESAHKSIDDDEFSMRYLIAASRNAPPVDVFKSLLAAFMCAQESHLVVGTNILSREDGPISMRDYRLHMRMFKFMHEKFPGVKYSMHAGELTLGLVKPEELTWHIDQAVHIAGASRIGHGVDIPYETNYREVLQYMSKQKIAVEINLVSNEFILKVKDSKHPIGLYARYNVPVVISTDDAGILRTNLTEQYVLLAQRYRQLHYADIKKFITNSIEYSFIKDPGEKKAQLARLDKKLTEFEQQTLTSMQKINEK